jgi:hypothetical protein
VHWPYFLFAASCCLLFLSSVPFLLSALLFLSFWRLRNLCFVEFFFKVFTEFYSLSLFSAFSFCFVLIDCPWIIYSDLFVVGIFPWILFFLGFLYFNLGFSLGFFFFLIVLMYIRLTFRHFISGLLSFVLCR